VKRRTLTAWVAVLLAACITCPAAAATPALRINGRLLSLSDLPGGWHVRRTATTRVDLAGTPCLRGLRHKPGPGTKTATASFVEGTGLPALSETLSTGETAAGFARAVDTLEHCRTLTLTINGKHVKATLSGITLPVPGTRSHAFSLSLVATGVPIGADIMEFRIGGLAGEIVYLAVGTPTAVTAGALAEVAVSKAKGHAVAPPSIVSVVSSPVKTAHTKMGTVGYREVGSGPPLLMIMGFAGTMETWDPRLVDALAHDYEVVIFDNAGIGHTQGLRPPLTIDAMADQSSALISALNLGKPDVLGWSMGSMIAQALAVLHPAQVNRLVLCAGYPGTGTVTPAKKYIRDLTNGTSARALAVLFPPNQRSAATGYGLSLSSWPKAAGAAAGVIAAQEAAITNWWSGGDPGGQRTSGISSPTLILDGAEDRLDPQANARRLNELIPGADVYLYADAGHAFLFQDEAVVTSKVEAFLNG
jgi:pimeloyl-ACP methyl ester carboxylesterase